MINRLFVILSFFVFSFSAISQELSNLSGSDSRPRGWYCSELAWTAYYNNGINIEHGAEGFNNPVAPKEIYEDSDTYPMGYHKVFKWDIFDKK